MNKVVKKVAAVALSALMVGGIFAGCSSNSNDKKAVDKDTYNVGICQLTQHDALDNATKGFKDKLNELAKADGKTINFDYQNASNDSATCATIVNKFVSSNYDLILANATPALQAAATATAASKIPVIGTSVTDYGTALDIEMDPTGSTGINVTGTSDLAPLADQAKMILDLFPDAKTADNGGIIDAACTEAGVPNIAGEEGIFNKTNAVATLSISFYEIGEKAGAMAYEILTKGTDPATMNIQQAENLTYYYNKDQANKFKAHIPENYQAYEAK